MAEKEKLERLKAKFGGNRAAVTKKLNEEKELLDGLQQNQEAAETHKSHLKVVRQFNFQSSNKKYFMNTTNRY